MMMAQPAFAPAYSGGGFAPPGFAGSPQFAPMPMAARPPAPPRPAPQQSPVFQPALAQQSAAGAPRVIRGQAPEEPAPQFQPRLPEPRPTLLRLPSPEELGVGAAPAVAQDSSNWSTAQQRLDQLGATCLHMEKLPQGGCRLTCLMVTAQAGRSHRIDVQASSPGQAFTLAVEKAEAWAARR